MTSIRIDDISDLEDFSRAVENHEWEKVVKMYKEKKELRTANIRGTGYTTLHKAVRLREESVVESMVEIVMKEDEENGYDMKNLVLATQDDDGDTPLHWAVREWSVKMCDKISGADPLLVAKRNKAGETPLFYAVLAGNKEAFLRLHYKYMSIPGGVSSIDIAECIKRDNQDTILHIALEHHKGALQPNRIDLAIEIVLLYKDHLKEMHMACMRNSNGLSPLYLLVEMPYLIETSHLLEQSFIVRLLYHCLMRFVRVEKEEATTRDELEQDADKKFVENLVDSIQSILDFIDDALEGLCWRWAWWILRIIGYLLFVVLVLIPLVLPLMAEFWFHIIRDTKERYTWTLQILDQLLQHASDEDMEEDPYKEEKEEGSKIVDTPLMIAVKNGITEVVDKILKRCPSTILVKNEEGKNAVLLSVEKRQTKVYQIFCQYKKKTYDRERAFEQVDKEGNTALHLAAKPGVNLNWQTTTMIEELKWFELVKDSVPPELREKYNNDGKTADEIFRENYKEHMNVDRQWLNQTSQTCSVASTLVASMAFSNIMADKYNEKNHSTVVALSLSLTSTICFLAILSFRSQSRNFWRYVPFILQLAVLTMFGSIVALWISLMFDGKALKVYAILGSPIAIFTILSLPIFVGPALVSMLAKVPSPNRNTSTSAIRYLRPKKKEDGTDHGRNQKPVPTDHTSRAAARITGRNNFPTDHPFTENNNMHDIGSPGTPTRITRRHTF